MQQRSDSPPARASAPKIVPRLPRSVRRWSWVSTWLTLVFVLVGCGQGTSAQQGPSSGAAAAGPVTLTAEHQRGTQALTLTLVVMNQTSQNIEWNGGCVSPYVVSLRDGAGALIQRWPPLPSGPVCNAITIVGLDPGASSHVVVVQTGNLRDMRARALPAGAYTVDADFTVLRYNGAGPATFHVRLPIQW